ncbi:hypothetical protein FNH22_12190 [Fulvivirga sp. M361]|uniref:hypothetical protein n=1 Tax=Fulvivirga sp. M361 TaxID=2594266 RepID=UPI00117AD113|nr:hypothetical protein [Fulvivirga sp. M361]TRX58634.1 hypothetical protein FNH22_12190 [Fulvivirga sp. M361]
MENQETTVMSVKDWVITLLISAIPLVGFIMMFVWAFGSGTNPNKANWAKGALIIVAIFFVLYFIFIALFGAALFGALSGAGGY